MAGRRNFQKIYDTGKKGLEKWQRAFDILNGMKEGDLVWTRRSRGHFFLTRITGSEAIPLYDNEYQIYDFGSGRSCEWIEVIDELEVPAEVKRNTRGTLHHVRDPKGKARALSEMLYNEKITEVYHLRELKGDLFDFLSPVDVEDLVGLYLQSKKNLLIVPSTSKQSTPLVEFWMISRESGVEAGVQVKTGNQKVNLGEYRDPMKYYFFQETGKPKGIRGSNHVFITKEELDEFARHNPDLLPAGIRRLVERLT